MSGNVVRMDVRRTAIPLAAAALLFTPAGASAMFVHIVVPGESLSSVAAADGLTVEQLAAANGMPGSAELVAGTQLVIPPQGGASTLEAAPVAPGVDSDGDSDDSVASPRAAASSASYVVQPGDTLSAIAAREGTTVAQLAAANGLDPVGLLLAGATLTLGGGETIGTSSAASSQPVGEAAQGSPDGPPDPTAETVSPEQIASIAAANGVPSSLASAIADQESGFNNALTSSADARGVMQITPGTWSWIDQDLAGSTPLAPSSALENVRGGVLLLHSLLESTGGDEGLAAAGYYQGLPSVLQHGEYPETRHYVEDVRALQQRFGG